MLSILEETARRQDERARQDNLSFAASDLAKSMLSLSIWFVAGMLSSSTITRALAFRDPSEEHLGLPAHTSDIPIDSSDNGATISPNPPPTKIILTLGSVRSILSILAAGLVYTLRAYAVRTARLPGVLTDNVSTESPDSRVCRPFYSVSCIPCDCPGHPGHLANNLLAKFPFGFLPCVYSPSS